jgi:hypothetical protein
LIRLQQEILPNAETFVHADLWSHDETPGQYCFSSIKHHSRREYGPACGTMGALPKSPATARKKYQGEEPGSPLKALCMPRRLRKSPGLAAKSAP